nr:flavocytochrome c [uncultured Niameybacter sp.]
MKLNKLLRLASCLVMSAALTIGCANPETATVPEQNTKETNQTQSNEVTTLDTDVVIVGAGGGGLSAAIEAHDAGANVIIVEKMPFVGGNTARATGGINAAGSVFQKRDGIVDSPELHYEDAMKGGEYKNDPELLKYMTEHAADAIDWLTALGADVSEVGAAGGASAKRIHRPVGGGAVGNHLVEVLSANTEERGIKTMLETRATELIFEDGKVTGIKATSSKGDEYIIHADAVVLASGGFGNNPELYTKYQPQLKGFVTTNQVGATGDGIIMGEAVGADLTDIEEIQIHPTVHQATASLITEGVRGDGAILVNTKGERFTNELLTRDKVSANILAQDNGYAYLVFDQHVRDTLSAIEKYIGQGIVTEAPTVAELAAKIGVDAKTLENTVATYTTYAKAGKDDAFGREIMESTLEMAPYYAIQIAPGVHHTMGGLKINTDTQVINTSGEPIPGLYAAGEVTGGVHGAERLGGNALTDIIVYGRQAGIKASAFAMSDNEFIGASTTSANEEPVREKIKEDAVPSYKDGVYEGNATGNNGAIAVKVTIKDGFIDNVEVTEHHETSTIFASIQKNLIPDIIYNQSTEGVDAVTGASNSSTAVFEAINMALSLAK